MKDQEDNNKLQTPQEILNDMREKKGAATSKNSLFGGIKPKLNNHDEHDELVKLTNEWIVQENKYEILSKMTTSREFNMDRRIPGSYYLQVSKLENKKDRSIMAEFIAAAHNINNDIKIKASSLDVAPNGRVYFDLINWSGNKDAESLNEQITSLSAKLTKMTKLCPILQSIHKEAEKEIDAYFQGAVKIMQSNDKIEDKAQALTSLVEGVAKKSSVLSPEEIIYNSKELVKNLVATKGKKEEFLYTLKEGCKWMMNKITFGMSPQSASQKIDTIFDKVAKEKHLELSKIATPIGEIVKKGDWVKRVADARIEESKGLTRP